MKKEKKILILDISGILYTYHYALKFTRSDGVASGALYGFLHQLKNLVENFDIKYVFAGLDVAKKSLRRVQLFEEYKANRTPMPEELRVQFDEIEAFLQSLNIKSFQKEGYEADDVIGSIAEILKQDENNQIYIFTKDKDMCQLLDKNVFLIYPDRKSSNSKFSLIKTEKDVIKKVGVNSYQIPDLFGLIGDSSDGIPGVYGVGKSVTEYILEYGTIENLIEHIDEIKVRNKKKIIEQTDIALLSRELATINRKIPLDINLDDSLFCNINRDNFYEICHKWEFKNIVYDYDKFFALMENVKNTPEQQENIEFSQDVTYFFECEYGFGFLNKDKIETYIYSTNDNDNGLFSNSNTQEELIEKANKKLSKDKIITYNINKYRHIGFEFKDFDDIAILHHLTSSDNSGKTLEDVYRSTLNDEIYQAKITQIKKMTSQELLEYKNKYIEYRLQYTKTIYLNAINKMINEYRLQELYFTLEKPLIDTIYKMEKTGIKIDSEHFEKIKTNFKDIIDITTNNIYNIGGEFNIDSPKQLSSVLFDKLKYPVIKKTKSSRSTDVEVLEELSKKGYQIAEELLNYRKYTKLLGTYILPLLECKDINNRIHTTLNQNGTVTGRLSSENPNLQVIPSRTEEGFLIRKGLVADEGYTLLSCDYSQVELRVLASLSKDKTLVDAYKQDLDLHELTARKLFSKKDNEEITREERNIAKIINFSVLYGKTPFGLAKEIGVDIYQAEEYINNYFEEYKGVANFIDRIIEQTNRTMYVETLFGTKRYIYDINSTNKNIANKAKRMAINTVVQGTASNIIKKVMLKLDEVLSDDIKMLIQIHDELIFEIKTEKLEKIIPTIVDIMENTVNLGEVKLKVNYQTGQNWSELK